MRRAKCFLPLIFLICSFTLAGQSGSQVREMFISAGSDQLYEYCADINRIISVLPLPGTGLHSLRQPQGSYSIAFESGEAIIMSQNHDRDHIKRVTRYALNLSTVIIL